MKDILNYGIIKQEYKTHLIDVANYVDELWGSGIILVKNFTDHSKTHSEKVIRILNKLISHIINKKNELHFDEDTYYLLKLSSYLHDIGLQCNIINKPEVNRKLQENISDFKNFFNNNTKFTSSNDLPDELQRLIRLHHHDISAYWLLAAYTDKNDPLNRIVSPIPAQLFDELVLLCKLHSKYNLDKYDFPTSKFNLKMMTALFRLADELDIGRHRINSFALDNYTIPDENGFYWYLNNYTEVSIENNGSIQFSAYIHEDEIDLFDRLLTKVIITDFKNKNSNIVNILLYYGVHIFINDSLIPISRLTDQSKFPEFFKEFLVRGSNTIVNEESNDEINESLYIFYDDNVTTYEVEKLKKAIEFKTEFINITVHKMKILENHSSQKCKSAIFICSNDSLLKYYKPETFKSILFFYLNVDEKENLNNNDFFSEYYGKYLTPIANRKAQEVFLSNLRSSYDEMITKIVATILHKSKENSNSYDYYLNKMIQWFFMDVKAEQHPYMPRALFVKTHAFEDIISQKSYFIVARKGSGKTTIVSTIESFMDRKYKGIIRIIANIDLDNFYNDYIKGFTRDIDEIFTFKKVLSLVWELYITFYSFYIICNEYDLGKLSELQKERIPIILKIVSTVMEEYSMNRDTYGNEIDKYTNISKSFYRYALTNVLGFINNLITKMPDNEMLWQTYLDYNFTFNNLVTFSFGSEKVMEDFYAILRECKKNILITLDGFDDIYNYNRVRNFEKSETWRNSFEEFEFEWLDTLLTKCFNIKNMPSDSALYDKIDVCLTIPSDRYTLFMSHKRDSVKFLNKFINLYWSGVELATLLRKRIEFVFSLELNGCYKNEEERLLKALECVFGNELTYIEIDIENKGNKSTHEVPLFEYVLRYTFWRPRDVLMHFEYLLADIKRYKKDGKSIDSKTMRYILKKTIKETSLKIVETDFYKEYETSILNIRSIIDIFKDSKIILKYEEIADKIKLCDFKCFGTTISDFNTKINILYQIGFLGIYTTNRLRKVYSLSTDYAFIFNEGDSILRGLTSGDFKQCKFIINPIFTLDQQLRYNTKEIVCIYNWKAISSLNIGMHSISNLDNSLNKK